MTGLLARTTAFVFGIGFAILPAVGPFFAVLAYLSSRFAVRRPDLVWLLASVLYGMPLALTGDVQSALGATAQILAGWLIYRTFADFARFDTALLRHKTVGIGLLVGLALVICLNLLRVEAWNFDTAKTVAQAIVWNSSPALFGHSVLVLCGVIVILTRSRSIRLAALALAALGILVSGSREAALGWAVIAVFGAMVQPSATRRSRVGELLAIALIVATATGLGPVLGWGKVGFLLQTAGPSTGPNLLQGTELAKGDWWDTSWVTVETREVEVGAERLTAYTVRKEGSASWLRLQQAVTLQPGTEYSVSAWIRDPEPGTRPGIQGWGQSAGNVGAAPFVATGALWRGDWHASVSGAGNLIDAGVAEVAGDWRRVFVTFEFRGDDALPWFVGVAPDVRVTSGTANEFAGFQLEQGGVTPYEPGSATHGLGLGVARVPYWSAAWQGIRERPLLGWGQEAFSDYFVDTWPGRARVQAVPAHAHNLFLHTWFASGIVGLAGLLTLLGVLFLPALARLDLALLALLLAVAIANAFDATLLYGGVFYPLLAIAGWRTGQAANENAGRSNAAGQVVVRLGLAIADTISAGIAVLVARQTVEVIGSWFGAPVSDLELPAAAAYGLILWPLLSWREGLYPGYGLTPQQELEKQATVSLFAALIAAAISVVLPTYGSLPASAWLLTILVSCIALPIGRFIAKRSLIASGSWGRRVILLGAGATGARIVRSLQRNPLDGLHPVAIFDDDPRVVGTRIHDIPVAGGLLDAGAFAEAHQVRHAIVAIPSLDADRLRDILGMEGRSFRSVQYVPKLGGFPPEDVRASSLDGMLALEVRNNLASRRNRVTKRAIDVVGATTGLALLSPVLLALWVWVRLDTRGPAIYRSVRLGQDGSTFPCLKYRTMDIEADQQLQDLLDSDAIIRDEYERFHKLQHDPRVTRAGRVLRRHSLDELPQLINVLLGHMSLVGPRPYLTRELPLIGKNAEVILQAKPGMTGYWQVSERNEVSFQERVEMEAHYVRNWSIWWDIVILANTFRAVLEKRGK